jgi:membrane protein required for colicin V production
MWIDVLWLLLMVMAVFKGLRQGFLLAVFSAVAFIVGLAAAIKLSATVAVYGNQHLHLSSRWWPVVAFILVFLVVVIAVRWGARLVEKMVDLAMMGWLNRLAGILLYGAIYTIILSVCLFYAVQVHAISGTTLSASITYATIRPWGPVVIDEFGKFVPWFKGMFVQLENFFANLTNNPSSPIH